MIIFVFDKDRDNSFIGIVRRLKTNFFNKLSYNYMFNMKRKSGSYEDYRKGELRKAESWATLKRKT
jgi:hypothetical protein